ncbi:hypothetical protein Hypma_005248 [Hypsizygus marmoreus]|uniref:Uncharacterized protein n=1 Tax=Hypsizygus marmoreus TaxID=39966 RepID=A0A369J114_HYPMA|nr:hypothetical protein Hypma_005248 [Hypsizygus marmoreus]
MLSLAMDRIVIVSMCTFDVATESVSVIITSRCPPAQMHLGSRDKDHEDAVLGFDGGEYGVGGFRRATVRSSSSSPFPSSPRD